MLTAESRCDTHQARTGPLPSLAQQLWFPFTITSRYGASCRPRKLLRCPIPPQSAATGCIWPAAQTCMVHMSVTSRLVCDSFRLSSVILNDRHHSSPTWLLMEQHQQQQCCHRIAICQRINSTQTFLLAGCHLSFIRVTATTLG